MKRINLAKNVHVNLMTTDKFKDVVVEIRFQNKTELKRATARALLAMMLADRSEKYDTKAKMNEALDQLYGASLSYRCNGYGKSETFQIRLRVIHESYVEEKLLQRQFEFLHEILFHPLLSEEVFNEAKRNLRNELLRLNDEPRECAIRMALEVAGEGQPLAVNCNGDLEVLEGMALQDVLDEYQMVLTKDNIDISIIGDIHADTVLDLCKKEFPFVGNDNSYESFYLVETNQRKDIEVEKELEQSILLMLYNTHTAVDDPLYWPLRLGNIILGQLPISLLFLEVREKRSLCYAISSSVIAYDGVLMVVTGMDNQQVPEARELIIRQIERIKQDDYDEALFQAGKEMLLTSIRTSVDEANAIFNLNYQNILLKRPQSIARLAEHVSRISRKDVSDAFDRLDSNTVFVLKKKERHHEENSEQAI